MQRGELSYAKVRALTRVATPEDEGRLVDAARSGTAAQIERLVRAWRRVDRIEAAQQTERRQEHRHLTTWVGEDGMLVIRGRLTPEAGAVVQRALEAAADQLRSESAQSPNGDRVSDDVTPAQRRADAWHGWRSVRLLPAWIGARQVTAIKSSSTWSPRRYSQGRCRTTRTLVRPS